MSLIEGLGDEVTYALLTVTVIGIVTIAWLSTAIRPFNYNVWLVQYQTTPARRILQVLQVNEGAVEEIRQRAARDRSSTWTVASLPPPAQAADDIQFEIQEVNPVSRSYSSNSQPQITTGDSQEEETTTANSVAETIDDEGEEDGLAQTRTITECDSRVPEGVTGSSETVPGGDTRIRLKFLDETQKLVAAWLSETVGEFKRQHFTPAVSDGQVVRLIYKGQLLRDDKRSLQSYGLHDNCILHCHVSSTPYSQQQQEGGVSSTNTVHNEGRADASGGGLQIGRYICLIFALKLAALWCGFTMYPQYFDFASLFSLVICTLVYVMFVYASYRARNAHSMARTLS